MKPVFDSKDITTTEFEDRWVKFAFGSQGMIKTGALNLGIVEFKPGVQPLAHRHQTEEALYIIQGEGKIMIGSSWFDLKAGSFVHIPQGENHLIKSSKDARLKILFIFGGKTNIDY